MRLSSNFLFIFLLVTWQFSWVVKNTWTINTLEPSLGTAYGLILAMFCIWSEVSPVPQGRGPVAPRMVRLAHIFVCMPLWSPLCHWPWAWMCDLLCTKENTKHCISRELESSSDLGFAFSLFLGILRIPCEWARASLLKGETSWGEAPMSSPPSQGCHEPADDRCTSEARRAQPSLAQASSDTWPTVSGAK